MVRFENDDAYHYSLRNDSKPLYYFKWFIALVIFACILTFFVGVYYDQHGKMHKKDIEVNDEKIKATYISSEKEGLNKKKQVLEEHYKKIHTKGSWLMCISVITGFVCGGILAVIDVVKASDKKTMGTSHDYWSRSRGIKNDLN
jgi:uncharacterized ion transporter superfamily protein YfcC